METNPYKIRGFGVEILGKTIEVDLWRETDSYDAREVNSDTLVHVTEEAHRVLPISRQVIYGLNDSESSQTDYDGGLHHE